MRPVLLATAALCGFLCAISGQEPPQPKTKELPLADGPRKPSAERLAGMKAALGDIEKGVLKQKLPSLTEPEWVKGYVESLRRLQPPVECEEVGAKKFEERRAEFDGYNAVMRAEIESRIAGDKLYLDRFKDLATRGADAPAAPRKIFKPEELLKPLVGELTFQTAEKDKWVAHKGETVGREFDTRRYIAGSTAAKRFAAVWTFKEVPVSLAKSGRVTVDLNFGMHWLTKGEQNRTAEFRVTFINRTRWKPDREDEYQKALDGEKPLAPDELAKTFGRFDVTKVKVEDGNEPAARLAVPGNLFDGLKDGSLEVRVEFADKRLWAGFEPDDLLVYTR
jgi:hypothetical protein